MALKATIHKAHLRISNLDGNTYHDLQVTVAQHPSETEERVLVRLLAFIFHADPQLQFTKGLCVDEEPDLWQHSLDSEILLWIDVGLPSLKHLQKACQQSQKVLVYTYGGGRAEQWLKRQEAPLQAYSNLKISNFSPDSLEQCLPLLSRKMEWDCTIQENQLWLNSGADSVSLEPERIMGYQ